MDIKKYFDYNPDLELTVAQIGINKWDWICSEVYDKNSALDQMARNRFDILPVVVNHVVENYFQTNDWGDFSSITLKKITKEDVIYYRLSFMDLIHKMVHEDRFHYFLGDSKEVLGLISLNNLNCLAVYNYIYQIIASLEQLVSNYLKNNFDETQVLDWLENTSDKQANEVAQEFVKLKNENADNSIFHHLYFPTLGTLLKKAAPVIEIKKPELLNFRTKFCSGNLYWEIRNTVSHPVKPLFINKNSVIKVNELIEDYLKIKLILN